MPIVIELNGWQVNHNCCIGGCALVSILRLAFVALFWLPIIPVVHCYSSPLQQQTPSHSSTTTHRVISTKRTTGMSLAGPYLIDTTITPSIDDDHGIVTTTTTWRLIPFEDIPVDTQQYPTPGAQAWAALHHFTPSCFQNDVLPLKSCIEMRATMQNHNRQWNISVTATTTIDHEETNKDAALLGVLARILVQHTLQRQDWLSLQESANTITIHILDETNPITLEIQDCVQSYSSKINETTARTIVRKLFSDVFVDDNVEIVECVDRDKQVLGLVPRKLVHQYNLLHRGIGMFVTRDRPILTRQQQSQLQPDLYCHQRTASKRIFPSLFDMFVGGVSLAGEDPTVTARREVAEELGLVAALEREEALSPCLLTCIVCTGYNRCVVDLFGYTMNTQNEQIQWQAEEVAWGAFVPYNVVQEAAALSIARLVQSNQWPGRHPPVALLHLPQADGEDCKSPTEGTLSQTVGDWKNWDFVPDGLLVWEAWLRAAEENQ